MRCIGARSWGKGVDKQSGSIFAFNKFDSKGLKRAS
jgi:hypothetical protein